MAPSTNLGSIIDKLSPSMCVYDSPVYIQIISTSGDSTLDDGVYINNNMKFDLLAEKILSSLNEKAKRAPRGVCWKGYKMVGMKKKGGKKVPNCVPSK